MSIGETRTALDVVLWEELPLAQDMAAGIPSIRADLRGDNTTSMFGETSQERNVNKDNCHEGRSVGREDGIISPRVRCVLTSSVFRSRLAKVATNV